jgi:hypothetical protein
MKILPIQLEFYGDVAQKSGFELTHTLLNKS